MTAANFTLPSKFAHLTEICSNKAPEIAHLRKYVTWLFGLTRQPKAEGRVHKKWYRKRALVSNK